MVDHEVYSPSTGLAEFGRLISQEARWRISNAARPSHAGTTYRDLGNYTQLLEQKWANHNSLAPNNYVSWINSHNTGTSTTKFLLYGDTPEERLHYKLGISYMLASDFALKRMFSTFFEHYHNDVFPNPKVDLM